ncbi:MAG: hypothetical protein DCC75_09180 [Proteobacteria bacterium]|nr:MAG: hypothetical protein DCC75_09180 [Pseudomonadota bacterium]
MDKSEGISRASLTCLIAVVLLSLHAFLYLNFLTDDALISLRYAKRLLDGKGLTWTDGEYVEGYSNLLWVLCVAAIGSLGFDLVQVARVLGALLMAGAVVLTCGRSIFAALLLTSTGLIAAWSVGGLEQPLLAVLLALSLNQAHRIFSRNDYSNGSVLLCSLWLGLLSLSRSDGVLFTLPIAAAQLFGSADARRKIINICLLVSLPALLLGLHTAFRLYYYGEWVSNIAHVKISPTWKVLEYGIRYATRGYGAIFPLALLGGVGLGLLIRRRAYFPTVIMVFLSLAAWTAYMVFIGGDVNPPSRHFVPIAVLLCFGLRVFLSASETAKQAGWLRPIFPLIFLVHIPLQLLDAENRDAMQNYSQGVWRGKELGLLLKERFAAQEHKPLIAVDAAGAVPYWSELPALDMLGLNDRYLAKNPPANFGQGWIAHGLGSGEYVLKRSPDIIIFGHPFGSEPGFISGKELLANPEFHARYEQGRLLIECRRTERCEKFEASLWVRKGSSLATAFYDTPTDVNLLPLGN